MAPLGSSSINNIFFGTLKSAGTDDAAHQFGSTAAVMGVPISPARARIGRPPGSKDKAPRRKRRPMFSWVERSGQLALTSDYWTTRRLEDQISAAHHTNTTNYIARAPYAPPAKPADEEEVPLSKTFPFFLIFDEAMN